MNPETIRKVMADEWVAFDGSRRRLPYERRYVLVQIAGDDSLGMPPSVAVGYLRFASDDVTPYFVVPGFGRRFTVTHWNDCLGDQFAAPLWEGKQTIPK